MKPKSKSQYRDIRHITEKYLFTQKTKPQRLNVETLKLIHETGDELSTLTSISELTRYILLLQVIQLSHLQGNDTTTQDYYLKLSKMIKSGME
jgi:hypothetical protein